MIDILWMFKDVLIDRDIEIRVPPWETGVDPRHEHTPDFPMLRIFKPRR